MINNLNTKEMETLALEKLNGKTLGYAKTDFGTFAIGDVDRIKFEGIIIGRPDLYQTLILSTEEIPGISGTYFEKGKKIFIHDLFYSKEYDCPENGYVYLIQCDKYSVAQKATK